ncbi:MAG: bifunctional folylpolyglutamate synthase/dihydrofolate synthase [Gemmatimonadetes bacterium]|nr:bifunctional folylpolyglutamate synthase/dihydrofolate synthase [Gemmatimonadota bacterium]
MVGARRPEPTRLPETYRAALDYLFPRVTTIKFGLETTRHLLQVAGDPQRQFVAVHIGGTNGKGSVATMVAAALRDHGVRVGLYTSPHLISFRERIRVDDAPISREAVAEWTRLLRPAMEETGATFFEATTAMAFADFAARGVEVAVVEVGLGGRLDSTNVLHPLVSAVTHIALDHQKYLGETLAAIAREKAGIAKPGVPFVIGDGDPELAALLHAAGREAVGQGRYLPVVVPPEVRWTGPLAMAGPHQRRNAAVAAAILKALPVPLSPGDSAIASGLARARIPGRLDRRGRWLFDVAHNPDGVAALVAHLQATPPIGPVHALVSILGDKPWPEMLVQLDTVIDAGILTMAPTAAGRGWNIDWLRDWLASPERPPARARWHLEPDFRTALAEVERGAGTVLVTGSFHTVGDVMQARGMTV